MKKSKKLLTAIFATGSVLTLASCGGSAKNSTAPLGSLDMTKVVATANPSTDVSLSIKNDVYYARLRSAANDIVTRRIKQGLYINEYNALKALWNSTSLNSLSDDVKNLITPTITNEDDTTSKLFELTGNDLDSTKTNYEYIYDEFNKTINNALASQVFGTTSYKTINGYTQEELDKKLKTFIVAQARVGATFTTADLAYTGNEDEDTVTFNNAHQENTPFATIIEAQLIQQAEILSSRNALAKIVNKEYIKEYNAEEDDDEIKNSSYNLFIDDKYEANYNGTYKTYGTYHAIVIQFNSRKEAEDTIAKCAFNIDENATLDEKVTEYLKLYNAYYNYGDVKTDKYDEDFTFTVSKNKNELNDLSSAASTIITEVLEDEDCLTEPRNQSGKYVMALRYETIYDYHKASDETEQLDYDDLKDTLTEAEYNKLITKIKYYLLTSSSATYSSTNLKTIIYNRENDDKVENDIYIYDPVFENLFATSNTDYEFYDAKYFDKNNILKIDDFTYSVDDFYKEASKAYSASILTNLFELEYAYLYYDEYVESFFIDDEAHSDNEDALNSAISTFNDNNNSAYPKDMGLENYLTVAYGYATKEDILKYYYDAKAALTTYKEMVVFSEWADEVDGSYVLKDSVKNSGALANILKDGNAKYSDIMSINLDHILINIDVDGDGSPDDPDEFTKDMDQAKKAEFEEAVVTLAKYIYDEASSDAFKNASSTTKLYKDTLFNILTFIKKNFEEGNKLYSDSTKTWDDIKEELGYNFLLTVEQLASSGNITQSSVSNFVVPFADYVKGMYKTAVEANLTTSYTNGRFYVYNTDTEAGNLVTNRDQISTDTLCKTVFGYHLIVLNSYSTPSKTDYTADDDSTQSQAAIELLLFKNTDDSTKNIYVTMNSYNEEETQASFNQLFIYFVQKANGDSSSLSSTISSLMSSLFDDLITTYKSDNFQNVFLLDYLDIQVTDALEVDAIDAERNYYANVVCDYDEESDYYIWVFDTDTEQQYTWTRPDQK